MRRPSHVYVSRPAGVFDWDVMRLQAGLRGLPKRVAPSEGPPYKVSSEPEEADGCTKDVRPRGHGSLASNFEFRFGNR
jgi:hypothetical protein